jgi:hypothetical protein
MMSDDDRKKVFWLLKKYSSYTAWKALADAFQAFTDAWEYAVKKVAPEEQDEFITGALKNFWDGCTGFDKGLALLLQGDRYIFRVQGNWRIYDTLDYTRRLMDTDEYVHDWMINKDDVFNHFRHAINLIHIFMVSELRDPTTQRAPLTPYNVFTSNKYPYDAEPVQFNFPPDLADVPAPTIATVETGQEVPLDGIWEPEWADAEAKAGIVTQIRSMFAPNIPDNVQKGCMNYLVAGTIAPLYQDAEKLPNMSVRWRLIWQDTRYRDGRIPEEEKDYMRINADVASDQPFTPDLRLRAMPGALVPQTGFWWTPAMSGEQGIRHFKQGDHFPNTATTNYGVVIWYYDPDKQSPAIRQV